MVVIGRLNRSEALAQALTVMRRRLIDASPKPEDQTDEQWAQVREAFANAPMQFVAEREQYEAQTYNDISEHVVDGSVDVNDLPEGLARRIREVSSRPQITLSDARVAAPGQQGMTALPIIRVNTQHVTAWWFAMPEEDGTSNIELWND